MPTTTVAVPLLNRGPGILWKAPLGTALPAMTGAGSVFTDLWSAATGWFTLGATDGGTEATYQLETEDVTVEEFLDPLAVATTGRTIELAFSLASFTKTTLLTAYNAPSSAAATSGTGATLVTTITPPGLGTEVNCMIGFESEDSTYRAVYYNARQVGGGAKAFKNGAAKTVVPMTFRCLADSTLGIPFKEYLAGAARGA